ncbi:MAG: helix-hairpin-helix domain-containing protein [Gemmataceae bacterium]|nr:helix-hairpin-helix domain-containing protein [Gemmataceae bacterium]
MITRMTGVLNRVLDEEVRLQVGPLEYQILVPETVRRQLQNRLGQEVTLHTLEYLEGVGSGNRFIPRLVGFHTEAELELFELFCTVEKIGIKKALKAMARPSHEIADAISRQDVSWLSTLPGVGAATAEQIVATLKRKVTRLAFTRDTAAATGDSASRVDSQMIDDVYQALLALGHSPLEARQRLDILLASGKSFRSVEEALTLIYSSSS